MKTGFVGAGKMAEAIIASLLGSKTLEAHEIFASDINADRREELKKKYGINVYSKNSLTVAAAEVVFLSVKPQDVDAVLMEIASDIAEKHLVVSIVAGRHVSSIEAALPSARVIRVMPNLASLVSEGMSVFCLGGKATPSDKTSVAKLFSCLGKALELPEHQFDAVTALSGSGPAFLSYLLEGMAQAATEQGLRREDALLLAEQTMLGTSRLLMEHNTDPMDLIKSVASAKGTTAAGMAVLEQSPIFDILRGTIQAAAERSRELSRGQ